MKIGNEFKLFFPKWMVVAGHAGVVVRCGKGFRGQIIR